MRAHFLFFGRFKVALARAPKEQQSLVPAQVYAPGSNRRTCRELQSTPDDQDGVGSARRFPVASNIGVRARFSSPRHLHEQDSIDVDDVVDLMITMTLLTSATGLNAEYICPGRYMLLLGDQSRRMEQPRVHYSDATLLRCAAEGEPYVG